MMNWLTREKFAGILLSLAGLVVVLQVVRIQTMSSYLEVAQTNQALYSVEKQLVQEDRGTIYDRWGNLLAGSQEVYEIGLDLAVESDSATIASTLSGMLGLEYSKVETNTLLPYTEGVQTYVILADFVAPEKANQIAALQKQFREDGVDGPSLAGLYFVPHLRRSYPEGQLASNVLGFYNFLKRDGGRGWYGIEEKYNDTLMGKIEEREYSLNPRSADDEQNTLKLGTGASLILTIDREIQSAMETLLTDAVDQYSAESGTIIVMDPRTGEILAMASLPQMDLNRYWEVNKVFPVPQFFNRAIGQPLEPGSVFKILTMASALDSGAVTPATTYVDTGIEYVGGIPIFNWDGGAYGEQDMTGCLQHSLNTCLSHIAKEIGATRFYEYMDRFGIGQRTNIDLAGEVVFPMRRPGGTWWEIDLGTNSFGQGISVTPIQFITAAAAIANDGRMMYPHLVKAVIKDGQQTDIRPRLVSTPIKP
ncbi:MAG TPA: penicillin-binding protein 2, partial [Anaerolineaceae bacterium]|nr:penicillin-binding protein 2 [Anaerolineaceae bacterium]